MEPDLPDTYRSCNLKKTQNILQLFYSLSGYLPFNEEHSELTLQEQIMRGRYRFSAERWQGVSMEAKSLMKKMLTVQVDRRITLNQILLHPWMQVITFYKYIHVYIVLFASN